MSQPIGGNDFTIRSGWLIRAKGKGEVQRLWALVGLITFDRKTKNKAIPQKKIKIKHKRPQKKKKHKGCFSKCLSLIFSLYSLFLHLNQCHDDTVDIWFGEYLRRTPEQRI